MKKTNEEKIEIDSKRKEILFQMGELVDLVRWLENGYKDCEGRKITSELLWEKIGIMEKECDRLFKEIFN